MGAPNFDSILDAALAVALEQEKVMDRLRAAVEHGTDAEVRALAREACGLYDDQPNAKVSHSTSPRQH